jgi:hypothetical protein
LGRVRFAEAVARPACKFTEADLGNWKLLEHFRELLRRQVPAHAGSTSEPDARRKLTAEPYFCLHLFRLFNTVLHSMRALCTASQFQKMREVCPAPVAPSSFSEAQHLFAPEMLEAIVRDLARQAKGRVQFGDAQLRAAIDSLTIVDGTVLRAVNRMTWAPASGHGMAIRLHLHFSAFDQLPVDWSITPGNVCERKEWKKKVQAGSFVVADRLYGADHLYLKQLKKQGVDFVLRLLSNVTLTPVTEPRPLSAEDQAAGVLSDRKVELGCLGGGPVLRVVEIQFQDKHLLLVTTREDLPAHLIGLIYRYRWQIELFFKWFKTMLPCKHWIAESPRGVAIQIYSVMIASLLLLLWTGRRPTKRQMEALRLFWIGFITEQELLTALDLEKNQ